MLMNREKLLGTIKLRLNQSQNLKTQWIKVLNVTGKFLITSEECSGKHNTYGT